MLFNYYCNVPDGNTGYYKTASVVIHAADSAAAEAFGKIVFSRRTEKNGHLYKAKRIPKIDCIIWAVPDDWQPGEPIPDSFEVQALQWLEDYLSLPELTGSPRRIAWARKIRYNALGSMEMSRARNMNRYAEDTLKKAHLHALFEQDIISDLSAEDSASFWIDYRDDLEPTNGKLPFRGSEFYGRYRAIMEANNDRYREIAGIGYKMK